ncbi:hypothetical protein C7999DRAFT_27268 [Corynascus novoguineensis]|uniref:Uncharacterized protein n=1 Tax=Corynascus novoguineensis TaxID=1126955 RepID=A0AAN7D100_9PEZI|nr:hypothetical protein C7999DRAFT_27268 [Corynascus novoguineensis]
MASSRTSSPARLPTPRRPRACIFVKDTHGGNHLNGKLADFSRSWTIYHPALDQIGACKLRSLMLDELQQLLDYYYDGAEHSTVIPQDLEAFCSRYLDRRTNKEGPAKPLVYAVVDSKLKQKLKSVWLTYPDSPCVVSTDPPYHRPGTPAPRYQKTKEVQDERIKSLKELATYCRYGETRYGYLNTKTELVAPPPLSTGLTQQMANLKIGTPPPAAAGATQQKRFATATASSSKAPAAAAAAAVAPKKPYTKCTIGKMTFNLNRDSKGHYVFLDSHRKVKFTLVRNPKKLWVVREDPKLVVVKMEQRISPTRLKAWRVLL